MLDKMFSIHDLPATVSTAKYKKAVNEEINLNVEYEHDYNILRLHEFIIHKLTSRKLGIPDLRQKIEVLNYKMNKPSSSFVERQLCQTQISQIQASIDDIETGKTLNTYIQQVSHLITEYSKYGPLPIKKQLTGSVSFERDDIYYKRLLCISSYLLAANTYIEHNIREDYTPEDRCMKCGESLESVPIVGSIKTCNMCSLINESRPTTVVRENHVKNNDQCRENYSKAIMYQQGALTPSEVYTVIIPALIVHFKNIGFEPSRDVILESRPNKRGRKDGTNRKCMKEALKSIGKPLYAHMPAICAAFWGWVLLDLTEYTPQLMEEYDLFQPVLDTLTTNKKSNINLPYRLYQHMREVGAPCYNDDFNLVSSELLAEYDRTWEDACRILGKTFRPTEPI